MGKSASLANFGAMADTQLGYRDKIINGNFDIWQRGTSNGSTDAAGFLADRFRRAVTGSTLSQSRQAFALGQTAVPGEPTYYWEGVCTSSAGASNYALLIHPIESVRTLAGQKVTVSFYAKADASKNMSVELRQYFGSGGSPSTTVDIAPAKVALTTSWQKFTFTTDMPSIAGKTLGSNGDDAVWLQFWFDAGSSFNSRTSSLGQQSGTFSIARVRLEPGPVALEYEDRPRQVELALCQRYYQQYLDNSDGYTSVVTVYVSSTTQAIGSFTYQVPMRAAPTYSASGSFRLLHNSTSVAITSMDAPDISSSVALLRCNVASGFTANQAGLITQQNDTSARIKFSAEL